MGGRLLLSADESYPWDDALARPRAVWWWGELKALLWHQGESDSKPDRVLAYEGRFTALIERFRTEFGEPNFPF